MSHQCLADAFAQTNALYRAQVRADTWGHLAPVKNKSYRGTLVYAVGCLGNDPLNPIALSCEFESLDSSPWFYDAVQEFMQSRDNASGCVYEFKGTFKNYKFKGTVRTVFTTN